MSAENQVTTMADTVPQQFLFGGGKKDSFLNAFVKVKTVENTTSYMLRSAIKHVEIKPQSDGNLLFTVSLDNGQWFNLTITNMESVDWQH